MVMISSSEGRLQVLNEVGGGEMVVLGLMKARVDGGEMVVLGLMKARVDGEGASEGRVKAVVLEWEDGVQLDKVWLSERLGVGEENDEGRGWRLGVVAVGDDFSSVEFGWQEYNWQRKSSLSDSSGDLCAIWAYNACHTKAEYEEYGASIC
ncbi:hypothetical protein V6N13_018866 [Hibiscus sabdariffa]